MYFRNYGLRKTWLDKHLKRNVSEEPFTGNVVNVPKHCFNLEERAFNIFIDPCEGNSVLKVHY